jgi:hypothetical protein
MDRRRCGGPRYANEEQFALCRKSGAARRSRPFLRARLAMTYDVKQLLSMSQAQLDDLFASSPAGDIPSGEADGTAIIAPGTQYTADIAKAINLFGWQGKVFDAQGKTLKNRILISGIEAIVAEVYKAPSWVDGKECIVLDYSKTSVVAQRIRDEIRQIAPGTYLGVVFWGKKRLIDFALHF